MRKKAATLSSLKNRISLRLKYDQNANHSCLAHLALTIVVSGLIALCGVNTFLNNNVPLQSVISATFCISAGILYAVYMIISRLLALVLNYAEQHSKHSYYDFTIESGGVCDDSDCGGDSEGKCERQRKNRCHKQNYISDYDDDDSTSSAYASSDDDDEDSEKNVKRYFIQNKKRHIVQSQRLPRNVVISSMYLGGSGAFLAIPALCMWDFTISAFFIGSMTILSVIDFGKIVSEFQPNVDTGSAVTNLKAIRYALHVAVMATISSVIFLDSIMSEQQSTIVFTNNNNNNNNNNHYYHTGNNSENNNNLHYWGGEIGVGLFLRWPLVLLAASSPVLLRAGGGGVGPFMHSLPPSQTLETGLPVSTLLAILVICWYSPLESTLLLPSVEQFKNIHLATFIPMMVLGPSLISASLAFVLRGFRNRSACTTAIILTCALVVKQQIHPSRRLSSRGDFVAIFLCVVMVCMHVWFVAYKRKVEIIPSATPLKTPKRKNLKHKTNIPNSDVFLEASVNGDDGSDGASNNDDNYYDDDGGASVIIAPVVEADLENKKYSSDANKESVNIIVNQDQ